MQPVDTHIKKQLDSLIEAIGTELDSDVVSVVSPILPGVDRSLRRAIEEQSCRKPAVAVILHTPGGVAEVVERMVDAIRFNYDEMLVIVPDRAMSAGTIFALSADRIMMDYFSRLGPVDPQFEKGDDLVPALSYLNQYERLNQKAEDGELTSAEYALLSKLDLGELYQFEQARELSIELLVKWLSQYKFKGWTHTETRGVEVTQELRERRAQEIATLLNDTERWHSHARGIDMNTLRDEVGLKIENLAHLPTLHKNVRTYFELLRDYMVRRRLMSFIHSRGFF